jgi:membrane protease YdiL (CAAX protease family)
MNNSDKDSRHKKLTLILIVSYLLMVIPINWILQYFLNNSWPDWIRITIYLIEYLIISLLIWIEKYHLEEFNIDLWSISLFLLFGSLFRPIYTNNHVVALLSSISFIFIAIFLFLDLRRNHIRLSRSCRPFIWLFIGLLFCIIELFVIMKVGIPSIGISGPTSIPIVNYLSSFLFYLCNVAIPEETVFRGFLWGVLNKFGYSFKKILIIQAILFTAAHIRFFQPEPIMANLGIFGLGIFFGFLAWKSKSIFPSIVTHTIHNIIVDLIH